MSKGTVMKIEVVAISAFSCPVSLMPGDTLKVVHAYDAGIFGWQETELVRHDIPEAVTWTHSILFKLNGQLNHIIGNQASVDWVEQLERDSK